MKRLRKESPKKALQEENVSALHSFLNWSSTGVYRSSLDGRILDCNEACAHILGYSSREEMLRADALEGYYDPSVRQKFIELLTAQGSLTNFEIHYRRTDGRHVSALESARIMDGTPPVMEGILIDITDRKRAEMRLQTQYNATRVLAESATLAEATPRLLKAICEGLEWEWAALWDADERAETLRCVNTWQSPGITNRQFEEASHQSNLRKGSGLPGRVWETQRPVWIQDVTQDDNFPRIALATVSGLHAALAFPIFNATEMLGVMEFFSRQIHQPDEDLLQMLAAIGSQVGQFMERKRAEMALRQSEERTLLIVKTALDAVVTMDAVGVITGWNPEAERTFGWSREEALGRRMSETIIPLQHREAHENGLRRFLETGEGPVLSQRIEITASHRDGHEFPIELAICAQQARGRWQFSAFIRNIAGRRQAEESFRRSHEDLEQRVNERTAELREAKEAAEAANRAKSEFLANMSHEIRTPMNGVIGMTELTLETDLNEEQRSYLTAVRSSAEALLSVINDILDFSKIEAGKLGLDHVDFDLRDAFWETLKALGVRADQKGLELSCDIHPGLPDVLVGDAGRLRQIMVNLVGNAIKFTEQGEVVVRVWEESRVDGLLTLHFTVSDTGIGIADEKQLAIFDAFTQADGSTTRKYGGTGLGLAISRQLVELMGGHIWLESTLGKGSSFHFTANFGIGNTEASQTRIRTDSVELRGVPVLVVDDNRTNRTILEKILGHWGMRVSLAGSGPAALSNLRQAQELQDPFKLILLDVCMPGMDGFDFVKQIREYRDLEQITIMMLSSAGMRGDALRCRQLQIAAYLVKPVGQKELRESVTTVLSGALRKGTSDALVTRHTLRESRPGFHILLAEDHPVNQRLAVKLLEKHGHRVRVAGNGPEALAALEKESFHLVLMDVQMPVMGGFEATAAIREREKATGAHIPIIAMTAHAIKGDRERCLKAGMDGYVSKPIKIRELLDAIDAAVSLSAKENEPGPPQPASR
ncbi:MAG: response regulator [Terriglobia bacterium]